jgi:hypothetical protein
MISIVRILGVGLVATLVMLTACVNRPLMTTGDGGDSITGFAVLRTQSGEARTCAGRKVSLVPDSAYAREHIMATFGSVVQGGVGALAAPKVETNSEYRSTNRKSTCNAQGNFSFEIIPDGT